MEKEFVPYKQALALKELGFDEPCFSIYKTNGELIFTEFYEYNKLQKYSEKSHIGSDWLSLKCYAPLYQQAFRWFREKYNFKYSIGITNTCVYHIPVSNYHTTFMLQDCESYEDAQLQCIKAFIDHAKQK